MFKKGDIVKIREEFKELYVIENIDSLSASLTGLKNRDKKTVPVSILLKTKKHKISLVREKIEVGDLVATNASDDVTISRIIYGEVGKIKKNKFFIWNNSSSGDNGGFTVPSRWKYSWVVDLDNQEGYIVFLEGRKKMKISVETVKEEKKKCSVCKEEFEESSLHEYEGDFYCDECWDESIAECTHCEKNFLKEEGNYSESEEAWYCQDCYSDNFTSCHHCGCELHIDSDDRRVGCDDNNYCSDCFGERFSYCSHCGDVFYSDDMHIRESDGEVFCQDCWADEGDETDEDTGERLIHDYSYKPEASFKKLQWDSNLYLGLELEVQKDTSEKDSAKELIKFLKTEKIDKHFYLKHDGSVPNGFEIVSHPFTLAYAHKQMKLNKVIDWMKKKNFQSEESGKCGLHIHLSRDFFEELDVTKMRLFFKENEKYLKELSGRKGVGENYCRFESINTKDILNDVSQSGRYWALNLNSSTNTLEIRMFRGTLNARRITAILQFVEALSYFVKEVGITSIFMGEREYKKNSWKLFTDWAKDKRKYTTMLNYMKGEKLCA